MTSLSALDGARFDVAIIGGGIIGAGIARDLAMRGASVALLDQGDFGGGTTSGSTRLVHGGLRYLEMLDFGLVRMDLRERETLLRLAPHLVKPLEFRVPFVNRSMFFRERLRVGLFLYDLLSYDKSLPNHRFLSAGAAANDEPDLVRDGLQGAASFYDAQVRLPERLCLENVIDAERHGAVVRNYCRVVRAEGTTLHVEDVDSGLSGVLHARFIVNATGAWYDRVEQSVMGHQTRRLRTTKGIHLVCGEMVRKANVLFSPIDGRLFFVIPLFGNTWIGTTDTDFEGDPSTAIAEPVDMEYLLRSVEPFFPRVRELPVYSTTAGVRALVRSGGKESSVSRMHKVEETSPGVISVLGGKITGYRAIAEEAAGAVAAKLGLDVPCRTAVTPLPGGDSPGTGPFAELYGGRAGEVEACAPGGSHVEAQARFAAGHEYARHVDDVLFRRLDGLFLSDLGAALLPDVIQGMSAVHGWTPERQRQEKERFSNTVQRIRASGVPARA